MSKLELVSRTGYYFFGLLFRRQDVGCEHMRLHYSFSLSRFCWLRIFFCSRSNDLSVNCFPTNFFMQCFLLTELISSMLVCFRIFDFCLILIALSFTIFSTLFTYEKLLVVYRRFSYCLKLIEEVFSLPPTQVRLSQILLFEGVSLEVNRMFHSHQNRTYLCTDLAVLVNISDHAANFPYFCGEFILIFRIVYIFQVSVNASVKLRLGCAHLFVLRILIVLKYILLRLLLPTC